MMKIITIMRDILYNKFLGQDASEDNQQKPLASRETGCGINRSFCGRDAG